MRGDIQGGRGQHLPRASDSLVRRPLLTDRIDAGAAITVVRAPLGFGKTTLLAQWIDEHRSVTDGERLERFLAWLPITSDCRTGAEFWPAAWHAARDAGLPTPAQPDIGLPAQLLRRAVQDTDRPVTLIVDGYERLTDVDVERDLRDLLRDSPTLHLVVSVRGNRHFRPATASGDDVEITGSDLLLTAPEAAELLARVGARHDLPRAERLVEQTGGWPELTHRAVRALADGSSTPDPLDEVVDEVTAAYVRDRLLPELSETHRRGLLASAVIDDLTAPLWDHLVSETPSGERLPRLERAGLVRPTGEPDTYRWPPAVRRALLAELGRRDRGGAQEMTGRAATWYREMGRPAPALDHAVGAGQWSLAVDIIRTGWRELFRDHHVTLFRALHEIPLEVTATNPVALLLRDCRYATPDDLVLTAVPELPHDPHALAELAASAQVAEVIDEAVLMLVALRMRGLFAQALDHAERLEALLHAPAPDHQARSAAVVASTHLQIGITRMLADDLPAARRALQRAYDETLGGDDRFMRRDAAGKLALTYALAGDARQATLWLDRFDAAPFGITDSWLQHAVTSTATCARLLVALDRLDLDAAARATSSDGPAEPDEFWPYLAYADALYALHAGNPADGLRRLHEQRARRPASPAPQARMLAAVEADLLMALGRGNDARTLLAAGQRTQSAVRLGWARLALLSGQYESAARNMPDARWTRSATPGMQQELLLIQATAQHALGHVPVALDHLRRALAAGAALESWRPFTTAPRATLHALAAMLPDGGASWLPRLDAVPELYPPSVTVVDLTARERAILHHLAEGMTRSQLAATLFISANTVKFHARGLYRKLHATNRQEAVSRARALGLLDDPGTGD